MGETRGLGIEAIEEEVDQARWAAGEVDAVKRGKLDGAPPSRMVTSEGWRSEGAMVAGVDGEVDGDLLSDGVGSRFRGAARSGKQRGCSRADRRRRMRGAGRRRRAED